MVAHSEDLFRFCRDMNVVRAVAKGKPDGFLPPDELAVVGFARKLTRSPSKMKKGDVEGLRKAGFSDEQILQIVQIAAYFNYINRVAHALGVPLDANLVEFERKLK